MDRELHVRYLRWRDRREKSLRAQEHYQEIAQLGLDPEERITFSTADEIARRVASLPLPPAPQGPPDEEFCQDFDQNFHNP